MSNFHIVRIIFLHRYTCRHRLKNISVSILSTYGFLFSKLRLIWKRNEDFSWHHRTEKYGVFCLLSLIKIKWIFKNKFMERGG